MRKREEEVSRVKALIDNDRLNFNKDFNKLFGIDLTSVLDDYFVLNGEPSVELVKRGKDYSLIINVSVNSFKAFSSVPKEGENVI